VSSTIFDPLTLRLKEKKPGDLTDDLRTALGMPVGPNAHKAGLAKKNHPKKPTQNNPPKKPSKNVFFWVF
jgi:hypothetical protein